MRYFCVLIAGVFLFLALSGCFRGRQGLSVIGYRNQMVFIKKDLFYRVGPLSGDWDGLKTGVKAAAFHNEKIGGTISTDAFCGASFEDLPLNVLTNQLFADTHRKNTEQGAELVLDGRGALRTVADGQVDGVPLKFDSVVVKKDGCTIDFIYIVPPENYLAGVKEFETFYGGFSFGKNI